MKKLLFFLICGTFVCACTITKRHFGKGYHVEWNRKIKAGPDADESSKMQSSDAHVVMKNDNKQDSLFIEQPEIFNHRVVPDLDMEKGIDDQKTEESQFQSEAEIRPSQEIKTKEPKMTKEIDDDGAEEAPKRRMHPLMWGIWAMWTAAIVCMFFVTFYAEALIGVAIGFFIAMIFALIVLRSMRKHPVKQPFKGLSYGFGIPAIVFGVIASAGVGLILVILFFA